MVAVAVLVPVGLPRGASLGSSCAVRTKPHNREMGEARFVSEQLPDLVANRVDLLRCERPDRAAPLAGKEFAFAPADKCIQAGSVPEVDVPRQSVLLERFEVSVDRGDIELQRLSDVLS